MTSHLKSAAFVSPLCAFAASLFAVTSLAFAAPAAKQEKQDPLTAYNVTWESQSTGSIHSMPLSGHNLGLNVWVENNDLLFLIGSPNCMDENGMQVKLGLVRIKTEPAIFANRFRQELRLRQSEIVVSGATPEGKDAALTLWCDAARPVVHATLNSGEPVRLTASYETWSGYEASQQQGGIRWVKRLPENNPRRLRDIAAQGMKDYADKVPDPLSKLTLGGQLDAPGMVPAPSATGKFNGLDTKVTAVTTAAPVAKLDLTFTLRMEQDASLQQWNDALATEAKRAVASPAADRKATLEWWDKFWGRSHIFIAPKADATPAADRAWQAGRNYQLVRYTLAANTSGRAMTLFNGGIFPCSGNPDKRNWDGCQFMAQNQRLVYWPMLRAGDFDMLEVAGNFYRDRTETRRLHARKFWNVDGVTYPEPFSIFGLDAIGTNGAGRSTPDHLHYHYTSSMEFALMMLELDRYTGRTHAGYREPALGILSYYDQFYQNEQRKKTGQPLDAKGRLVIYPSDALEPYHGCTNNTDVIAGLTALTRELLALPSKDLPAERRTWLEGFRKRIPEFPMKEQDGRKYFAAADSWEHVFNNGNMDFPQMYVCFPFSILSLGRSDMQLAKNTWDLSAINHAIQRQNQCWYQTAINYARMGMAAEAGDATLRKFLHAGARFPTFYRSCYANSDRDFCHVPDTDHGGVAMTALQEMLMQTDGKRILLAPAWPVEWNADFKLHAPYQTIVEGRIENGKVTVTKVTPESRRKDIEMFQPQATGLGVTALTEGRPATASSSWDGSYVPARAFDGDLATRWSTGKGQKTGWLEVDLGESRAIARAVICEVSYPRVSRFQVQIRNDAAAEWATVAKGSVIGAKREVTFPSQQARYCRLVIEESSEEPTIDEFQIFAK